MSLLSFLCMDSNRGQFIRSLQLGLEEGSQNALDLSDTLTSEILAYSSLPTTAEITLMSDDKTKYAIMASAFQNLSLGLLVQLQHLEELIVLDQAFYFPLRIYLTTDSGTQVLFPLPFLTNSIKKLYILLASDNYVAFSARNSVWLMVFCKSLNEISIGFDISANDVAFLAEYKEIFKHKSNVKKLAIQFRFKAAQKAQSGLSKIQKEQSLSDLLLVTNGLEAFEFNGNWAHELDETLETQPNYEGAFSSLSSSESSLRHLRRFGTLGTRRSVISTSPFILKSFKNLRMLSTDLYGLFYLRHRAISLDVEILQMVYYYVDLTHSSPDTEAYADFRGIEYLVEAQLLPNLKTLMIPKQPINMTSEIDKSPSRKAIWAEKRSRFLSKDYFKNGRIKVIEFEAGELCECCFWH